jgi:hypothetical protein
MNRLTVVIAAACLGLLLLIWLKRSKTFRVFVVLLALDIFCLPYVAGWTVQMGERLKSPELATLGRTLLTESARTKDRIRQWWARLD